MVFNFAPHASTAGKKPNALQAIYEDRLLRTKRVYDLPAKDDGYRVLVDRLWPRGISKNNAQVGAWLGDIAPSDELRRWFNYRPEKWTSSGRGIFKNSYATGRFCRICLQERPAAP